MLLIAPAVVLPVTARLTATATPAAITMVCIAPVALVTGVVLDEKLRPAAVPVAASSLFGRAPVTLLALALSGIVWLVTSFLRRRKAP
ncbi:hypothetical protein [Streptomyces cylindrosporus]|uniref:Uncharacterized protein n=1 Tax=Streptomyces cylindrosporus TaxID=2927583 RepID=A0ABS9Y018_9ACTN|nr:hypothetical protein [Streptomyces cylindrosporus]MCI3270575.1 hypothetical protein [Streptomyces cylindrosporus]